MPLDVIGKREESVSYRQCGFGAPTISGGTEYALQVGIVLTSALDLGISQLGYAIHHTP